MLSRSVVFGGRKTSLRVEDQFWKALREIARRHQMTLGELIETINANRTQGNLSSAIRLFVLMNYQDQIEPREPKQNGAPVAMVA
jgi:predicted DNA-binding ribbon-helix-helix protein